VLVISRRDRFSSTVLASCVVNIQKGSTENMGKEAHGNMVKTEIRQDRLRKTASEPMIVAAAHCLSQRSWC
jgi:hypothetical protein